MQCRTMHGSMIIVSVWRSLMIELKRPHNQVAQALQLLTKEFKFIIKDN